MLKIIAIMLLMATGCGQSECQKYAAVYCGKASSCGYERDGVNIYPAQAACEADAAKSFAAANITEEQCKTANAKVAPMGCADFRAFVTAATAR